MGFADFVVMALLAVVVLLAVRSIVKSYKNGGCGSCRGCERGACSRCMDNERKVKEN